MTLSHSVSDLRLGNKNLKSEKASLLTALKLIQDDITRMTETTNTVNQSRYSSSVKSMEKTTKPNECNSTNIPNGEIEQTRSREVADRTKQGNEI